MPASKDDNAGQSAGLPEPIFAGAAVSRGRVFFVSTGGVYAIGPKTATPIKGTAIDEPAVKGEGGPAWVQVSPTALMLKPGQAGRLPARVFDAQGRFLREDAGASWTLAGLKGAGAADGSFTPPAGAGGTARAT